VEHYYAYLSFIIHFSEMKCTSHQPLQMALSYISYYSQKQAGQKAKSTQSEQASAKIWS